MITEKSAGAIIYNAKNKKLIKERHISFEAVVSLIESGNIIALVTGKGKYAHQKQFIVELNRYIYVIPFVEDEKKIFLKTIFIYPSVYKQNT